MSDYPWTGKTATYVVSEINEINSRMRSAEKERDELRQQLDQKQADLDRALARVAELEEGLAGIENCAFGYQGCRQTAEEAADWMNAEATRLLEGTNGAHTLRKQAEAVESVAWLASRKDTREIMSERISELRKKADQMENTHD